MIIEDYENAATIFWWLFLVWTFVVLYVGSRLGASYEREKNMTQKKDSAPESAEPKTKP